MSLKGEEHAHCINATCSAAEIVNMYGLAPIDKLENKKCILINLKNNIVFRENCQRISHATRLKNGDTLVLIQTLSWPNNATAPKYSHHFHCVYKMIAKKIRWESEEKFCPAEFEPEIMREKRIEIEDEKLKLKK